MMVGMRGVNKVILVGKATRDAGLRHTSSGKAVSGIPLATKPRYQRPGGTQFYPVVCWGRRPETTGEHVNKGAPLYVEGRRRYRFYQDEEGKERGVAEFVAGDVQFLGRRRDVGVPDAG